VGSRRRKCVYPAVATWGAIPARRILVISASLSVAERHIRANICTCSGARFEPVKDTPNAETA
jgi:hypothetical protein